MELDEALAKVKEQEEKIQKLNDESSHHRKSGNELRDKLAAFDGVDPDDVQKMIKGAAKAKQDKLKSEERYDEALAEATKTLKAENEQLVSQLGTKDGLLTDALIDGKILSSIDGKAINPGQILTLLKPHIKMENGIPVPMNGEAPATNEKGARLSVDEFAQDFLSKNPHFVKASGGGANSGGNSGGQSNSAKTMTRSEFDSITDPSIAPKFFAEGGKVVD